MPSYEVEGPIGHLHASFYAETMESLVLLSENSHFLVLTSLFLHPKSETFGSKIAPSATVVTASSPSVANRGAHKTLAGLVFGAQTGQYCSLTLSIHLHGEFISGLKCHPMRSKVPSDTFMPHVMPKPRNYLLCHMKPTLFDGHPLTFAPKILAFECPNCTFGDCRGGLFTFCREPWCSPDSSGASIWCTERTTLPSYLVKSPSR